MIDPDGIIIEKLDSNNIIDINNVAPFETEVYCLDDEKEYKYFVSDVEKAIRKSFEYREMIKYLRDNMQMNKCAFLEGVTNEETFDIKIEIHHYPFTLHDLVEIVLRKRIYYNESLTVNMVAKEVMKLHYQLLVGLIPLSQTVHELAHNGKIFIPSDKVFGNYNKFVTMYEPFCEPEQLDALKRIEKYTEENRSPLLDTTILNQNYVTYNVKDERYQLPDTSQISNNMIEQMELIKKNNFILPTVNEVKLLETNKQTRCPLIFDKNLINNTGKYSWE